MGAVVLHAVEASGSRALSPSSEAIGQALRTVRFPAAGYAGLPGGWGAWLGPRPRITRAFHTGLRPLETHAAWVWQFPEGQDPERVRTLVQSLCQTVLEAIPHTNWRTVEVVPYAEAVNGALEWWQSGQSAVTQTERDFPAAGGLVEFDENPVGPTSARTQPRTLGSAFDFQSWTPWLIFGAVCVGAILFWPQIAAAFATGRKFTRRRQPAQLGAGS